VLENKAFSAKAQDELFVFGLFASGGRGRRTTIYWSAGRLLLLHVVVIFQSSDESHLEIVSSAGVTNCYSELT